MKFTKMHGCGNDYVYINCFEEEVKNPKELAIKVSNRNFGVGSDGLILICPSDKADFRMDMYNADGSQSEMCGNGIRCVGKYVYDYGLTDKEEVSVETLAGIKYLKFQIEDGKVKMITVDMGEPELIAKNVPVISENEKAIDEEIIVDGKVYRMTCVSMGNPHAVVFVDSTSEFPLEEIGPKFESHERFPRRVNAEFVQILNENEVNMRVWERGTGETLACGTGTCATAVACVLNGKTNDEVKVHLLGGDLIIKWDRQTNHIYMTGPAKVVFDGVFSDTVL
ncbi:MAG: diaminopimelate epimerase [Lachnospiraceae bacterium]